MSKTNDRPSWHKTWMMTAKLIAARSYDDKLKVGTIIVSEDNTSVLAVGFNGNYAGGPNERESDEPGQGGLLHSELNACLKLDYNFPKKKVLYVTHSPCRDCCKIIVNAGISRVIYEEVYRETSGLDILKSCGIVVNRFEDLDS